MTPKLKLIFAFGSAFGLTACSGGNINWTAGEWTVLEYSYIAQGDSSNGAKDGCGIGPHLESLEGLSYTLGAAPDFSDPDYNPNDPNNNEYGKVVEPTQSGELTEADVALGEADLWNLCSTASPSFFCTFAMELIHQDQWLDSLIAGVCEEDFSARINSDTNGLMLNENMLLTNSSFSIECVNSTTDEHATGCESHYSTRLVSSAYE